MPKAKDVIDRVRSDEDRGAAIAQQVRERSRKASPMNTLAKKATTTRRAEAIAAKEVAKPVGRRYVRPSALPGIPNLPGYHMEYVRRDNANKGDYANLRAHLRSQWEIVRASEIDGVYLPTIALTGHGDCIGNEDSILMKLPEDLKADRDSQYTEKRDSVTRAVNSKTPNIETEHPQMPVEVLENRTAQSRPQVRVKERAVGVASD